MFELGLSYHIYHSKSGFWRFTPASFMPDHRHWPLKSATISGTWLISSLLIYLLYAGLKYQVYHHVSYNVINYVIINIHIHSQYVSISIRQGSPSICSTYAQHFLNFWLPCFATHTYSWDGSEPYNSLNIIFVYNWYNPRVSWLPKYQISYNWDWHFVSYHIFFFHITHSTNKQQLDRLRGAPTMEPPRMTPRYRCDRRCSGRSKGSKGLVYIDTVDPLLVVSQSSACRWHILNRQVGVIFRCFWVLPPHKLTYIYIHIYMRRYVFEYGALVKGWH